MTQPDSIKMSYLSPPYQRSNTRTSEETPIVYGQNSATEKSANVAVTEVGLEPRSPTAPLAYRRTDIIGQRRAPKQVLPMDRFLKTCAKQTPFVTGLIFTIITAIPFVVFLLVAVNVPRTTIGGEKSKATLAQLAKWLLVCWGGFIGLLWIGNILAAFFSWFCGLSARWVRYQRLAEAICLRFVLLLWAIVIWAIIPRIFHNSVGDPKVKDWATQLQRAFMFIAIAFAILLVQGIILELAAVNYIQGWMGPRSQRASDELDTIKQLHTLVNPHARGVSMMGKIFERLVLPSDDRDLYYQISHGRGDAEIWKQYADRLWNSVSQGNGQTSVLRQIDLIQQLERMGRDGALGQMLFTQLDASCDGEVTLEEVENLVHRVGVQLNMRAKAQGGIKSLLRKLEILLSIVVLGLIIFLYGKSSLSASIVAMIQSSFSLLYVICANKVDSPNFPIEIFRQCRYALDWPHWSFLRFWWCTPRVHSSLHLRLR